MKRTLRLILGVMAVIGAVSGPALAQGAGLPGPSTGSQFSSTPPGATASSASNASAMPAMGSGAATLVVPDDGYKLGAGDKMRIAVYGEDDLTGEFIIDGSGEVQFPLLGQIDAAGLTVHQFVENITTQLGAKYLRDPKVSVQIENYRPFYIMGEVNKPGEYPFENGLTVPNAVALAGGYTYRANSRDVYIRRGGGAQETPMRVDGDIKIYPGDVVRIPERIF